MAILPLPPSGTLFFDPRTNSVSLAWTNYLLAIASTVETGFAPADAQFWTSTANPTLTNEENLGSLTTGYLKIAVSGSIATPATVTTIPTSDLNGLVGKANGGTGVNLSGTGGTTEILAQDAGHNISARNLVAADIPLITTAKLSDYTTGTWTPIDSSGAGLTFTSVSGTYVKIGTLVHIQMFLIYPATASGAGALIGGLPFTAIGTNGAGGSPSLSSASITYQMFVVASTTTLFPTLNTSVQVTNAQLSGSIVSFGCTYQSV